MDTNPIVSIVSAFRCSPRKRLWRAHGELISIDAYGVTLPIIVDSVRRTADCGERVTIGIAVRSKCRACPQ